ncbi:cleavage stimulating factor 64 [Dorcoceras hygrometricum]|uniref:Cleavage stimulating factor 64 n=1 Tax=Dorcoceras hygrometricum TaxID=472368 RepID=A0A2Z7CNI1_9LAMI|nr:cleavage stimulating factor 64 [Dorcoceras hygrometricum]
MFCLLCIVGNIPYDATEEQLIQICEEVGPVLSFRLVTDRETGKPKGYGFCEYKDEETALSARRNLQGYEINGRQLRVDFAENDKNVDRNREQGRGGPGIAANIDPQKHVGGPVALGDPNLYQPLGDSVAMAAATVMAGAIGAPQNASSSDQIGLQTQALSGIDPLTRHLAKMSRNQLIEIMAELKAMATQNKEQALQVLLAIPNLAKALFQAQLMLGMVSPQMLQMPNIRQPSVQSTPSLVQSGQALPGLPPLPQNKPHIGLLPASHEIQMSAGAPKQYAPLTHAMTPSQIQNSLVQNQIPPQAQLLVQSGVSSLPSVRPQLLSSLSVGPQIHVPISSSLNQQAQPTISRPSISSTSSAMLGNKDQNRLALSSLGKVRIVNNNQDQETRAPKLAKLSDGRGASLSEDASLRSHVSAAPQTSASGKQISQAEKSSKSEKQASKMQLPLDVDSTLLEQVLNLTPEQLSSLPPDQQQQVIQLQQMLRQAA